MNVSQPISPITPAAPVVAPITLPDMAVPVEQAQRQARFNLNPWLQTFLTIIAGTIVAVIVWNVVERFLHILVLLLASFLLAYLLGPLVDRLEGRGMARILAILLVYLVIIGVVSLGVVLLVGPLTNQLQDLSKTLPTLVEPQAGAPSGIDRFFQENGIPLSVSGLRTNLTDYISGAGSELLGSTLAIVAGLVTLVTDIFLALAITFYLLLDGRAMHNWALRFLPSTSRERWFFIEATLNRVLGGYIRGQLLVALTVGLAAGIGSFVLGVQYPLVIGLLAFLFEFIPLIGPVLGMIPAVIIAFFQSPTLALWVTIYFIVLQQVEANVIVPRVSGHAVGLHPLAALLALLAGVELGGLGGALLAVPVAGVLYVLALALYMDKTTQTELLVTRPRRTAYTTLRNVMGRRRTRGGLAMAGSGAGAGEGIIAPISTGDVETVEVGALPAEAPAHERLATIAQEQAELIAKFEADEVEQAKSESAAADEVDKGSEKSGPDDTRAPDVPV